MPRHGQVLRPVILTGWWCRAGAVAAFESRAAVALFFELLRLLASLDGLRRHTCSLTLRTSLGRRLSRLCTYEHTYATLQLSSTSKNPALVFLRCLQPGVLTVPALLPAPLRHQERPITRGHACVEAAIQWTLMSVVADAGIRNCIRLTCAGQAFLHQGCAQKQRLLHLRLQRKTGAGQVLSLLTAF